MISRWLHPSQNRRTDWGLVFALCIGAGAVSLSQTVLAESRAETSPTIVAGAVNFFPAKPLQIRNRSPLTQLYGLSGFRGARATHWEARFDVSAANSFTAGRAEDEFVRLDGETAVFSYQLRGGFAGKYEAGAELPWVVHSGGRFDGLIDEFHSLFGFPDGGRPSVARGEIDYQIQAGTDPALSLTDKTSDLGDARFWLGYELLATPQQALNVRAQLKLPTGTAGNLSGSGAIDIALNVDYLRNLWRPGLVLSLGAGIVHLGRGDLLPERQRSTAWSGHFGLSGRVSPYITLVGQLDAHAAPFSARTSQLGGTVLQGTLGGRVHVTPRLDFQFAVVEDLAGALAADVVFQFAIEGRL